MSEYYFNLIYALIHMLLTYRKENCLKITRTNKFEIYPGWNIILITSRRQINHLQKLKLLLIGLESVI